MNTRNFNVLDKIIAKKRLSVIKNTIKDDSIILDFGCGYSSYLLERYRKNIKLGYGLDYEVKNKKIGNVSYINFNFQKELPFKDNYFDNIYLLAVLEHIDLKKIDKLFKEFYRILKNNGQIILTTPTPKSKKILEFMAYNLKIISEEEIKDHKKYYNKNDIKILAKNNKLKLINYNLFQLGLNSYVVLEKKFKKNMISNLYIL